MGSLGSQGVKFNVDGVVRVKPGLAWVGGVVRNDKGKELVMFSKQVGFKKSYEAEVQAILEGLWIFSVSFRGRLVVESDSSYAIGWISKVDESPWKF